MFAEELDQGKSSRKRQEDARRRRRELKEKQKKKIQQQQQQQQQQQLEKKDDNASTISTTVDRNYSTSTAPMNNNSITSPSISTSTPTSTNDAITSNTAVEEALKQRRIRNNLEKQKTTIIKIQSYYKSYKTRTNIKKEQRISFDNRMHDIITLCTILKQQQDVRKEYIVPPATATMITIQLFYILSINLKNIKKNPRVGNAYPGLPLVTPLTISKDDEKRMYLYFQYIILPGLIPTSNNETNTDDEMLNSPIYNWLQTTIGKIRIQKLLYLCMHDITEIQHPNSQKWSIDIVSSLLGIHAKQNKLHNSDLLYYCGDILLSSTSSSSLNLNNLDIITNLRKSLIKTNGGILSSQSSYNKISKQYNDAILFDILSTIIQNTTSLNKFYTKDKCRILSTRIVLEIFTIPFLSWKISLHKFLNNNLFQDVLFDFINYNKTILTNNNILYVLPTLSSFEDYSNNNTAPYTICLLSNILQIGRLIPTINGSAPEIDYKLSSIYYDLIASILNIIPYSTLSEKQHSAIEWIVVNETKVPIVLNQILIEQCRIIFIESWLRSITNHSINEALNIDHVLNSKNKDDKERETKILKTLGEESNNAMNLASKEARINRQKTFWERNSKWALSKLGGFLSSPESSTNDNDTKAKNDGSGEGELLNTSSISRQLASNGNTTKVDINIHQVMLSTENKESKINNENTNYSIELLISLCRVYSILISRWGCVTPVNKHNLLKAIHCNTIKIDRNVRSGVVEPCVPRLLNVICFSTNIIKALWCLLQSNVNILKDLNNLSNNSNDVAIRSLQVIPTFTLLEHDNKSKKNAQNRQNTNNSAAVLLHVFLYALSHVLVITDDFEIHELDKPIPKFQLLRCIILCKTILYKSICCNSNSSNNNSNDAKGSTCFGISFISIIIKILHDLYNRSSRKPLCTLEYWLIENDDTIIKNFDADLKSKKSYDEYITILLNHPILIICPFLIPFQRRLKLFECIIKSNKLLIQGSTNMGSLFGEQSGARPPPIPVSIMRGRVLEDGLLNLNKLGSNLRRRIAVIYTNQAGMRETGIDAGGLFKEFWNDLCKLAFNPNFALFRTCTDGDGESSSSQSSNMNNLLYPNPSSFGAHGNDHIILFEFLGRILGKALYEGITIQPQFAHFFLSFLRGDYNYLHMLSDLSTMDPQLYQNLMFLKTYEGDASDLSLTFTVSTNDFGRNQEHALMPNGTNIEVTNSNKQRYVALVAKYYVCDRIKLQSQAFTRGLWDVIDKSWLSMFNEPELQVLISGSSQGGKLDIDDMKANTKYTGGYTTFDKHTHRFWNVLSKLSAKQQASFLRFVTSCERPPPLGFSSMNPPFTIQRVGILRDGDKLPSASTCFNTLKLPTYSSEKVLKERLIYSIEAGAGFELT